MWLLFEPENQKCLEGFYKTNDNNKYEFPITILQENRANRKFIKIINDKLEKGI